MGEGKVPSKYYPPDFDPKPGYLGLPRLGPKSSLIMVRMMLPITVRCNSCGNRIDKGTTFNSRKEDVLGETYLGRQVFRFYFKCRKCSATLTMKTDPQNSDYILESGGSRCDEASRAEDEKAEEMGDAMKSLENTREMDIIAALDEMKSMKMQ